MKRIRIDVMTDGGERFYRTLSYEWNDLFRLDLQKVREFVYGKLPTLKYEKDVHLVLDV